MARPRVFISSTFFDLRQVREDLERFIRELGYEPVRSETGAIPYHKGESPEAGAYREVDLCDILVAIIGGRYGTEAREAPGFSISQGELRRAIERNVQIFVFVERSVWSEFSTYQINKGVPGINYRFVDSVKVFEFLETVTALPRNNPIAPFETAAEICDFLRVQLAGLFHRFLQEHQRLSEIQVLDEMKTVASTLRELTTFLTEERRSKDDAIKNILLPSHPLFRRLATLTGAQYRVFFTNHKEMVAWLRARSWTPVAPGKLDPDSVEEYVKDEEVQYLKFTRQFFNGQGHLVPWSDAEWQDDWVALVELGPPEQADDEVPF